jgi:L-amino acid N-acyltransferase YncA
MAESAGTCVRAFNGSLADAQGVLAVERATFNESPYDVEQVRAMLSEGPQRAWLAIGGDRVVGFVIAFPVRGLRGWWWEVDLLAVLPAWRGRRLATGLLQAAASAGAPLVSRARAVVATDNQASARAFFRAGFSAEPGTCELLICRGQDPLPRPLSLSGLQVREAASISEARGWLAELGADAAAGVVMAGSVPEAASGLLAGWRRDDLTLLLAGQKGRPAGCAELIRVQTLLYRGLWIESLLAPHRAVREGLIQEAVARARSAGLDEIGAMVPQSDRPLQQSLLGQGFRSLGDYRWFGAELRDTGPPSPSPAPGDCRERPQGNHA